MKRVCMCAALAFTTIFAACSKNETPGSPTTPTQPTNPSVSVRAVNVTAAPMSSSSFQMSAKADLSDGTSRDVTTQAQWTTSSADIATVAASGVLTVVHSGQVEVRATYQSMTGSLGLTVNAPQPPPPGGGGSFILSGIVHETAPDAKPLGGVMVKIVAGPDAGSAVATSAEGHFGFVAVHGGEVGLEATLAGYQTWRLNGLVLDRDREIEVVMYPTPPTNASGVTATARCNDKSWSWAQTRAEACTANGGVAYAVCPGPMCDMQTATRR